MRDSGCFAQHDRTEPYLRAYHLESYQKGRGMNSAPSRFCGLCGAAIADQATICDTCGSPLRLLHLVSSSMPVAPLAAGLSAPVPAGPLRPGSLFVRRYRVLSKAGEGGFGEIYKAEDLDHRRRLVAIKQINLRTLSPREMIEVTDSYNREVRYLSQLRHKCIPRIYTYLTDPDHWYVVMDFIEGQTLEDSLKQARRGRFSTKRVLEIGIALCDVLGYLHAQHPPIIFRDVKPANIMLAKTGRIYLIDFGIARQYAPDRTRDTGSLGSPGYAAPEQYGKAQSTAQTDIYGLGATLQTLLTGKEPLELVASSEKQARKIQRRIPRKLHPLLKQMLEVDASKRPQSMEEVKQSLQRIKEHSVMYRVKQTAHFLIHSGPSMLLLVALLLFISLLSFQAGFFNSPFWIPCLLAMLGVIVGRSAYYLHRAMEEASGRLHAQEALGIVLKHLKGSILFTLIPAIVFLYLYAILTPGGPLGALDYLFLGGIVLAFIIGGLYFFWWEIWSFLHQVSSWRLIGAGVGYVLPEVRSFLRRITSWRLGRKQKQVAPLQQQTHKHP